MVPSEGPSTLQTDRRARWVAPRDAVTLELDSGDFVVGPFAALDHRFDVQVSDAALAEALCEVLGTLADEGPADSHYRILEGRHGRVEVRIDDKLALASEVPSTGLAHLLWEVNRRAVESTVGLVLLHAAGVESRGRAVVIAGEMESGKSTLCTSLLTHGLRYSSDELVAVTPDGSRILPYPKAVALDAGSWPLFPDLEPPQGPAQRWMPKQWLLPPQAVGAAGVAPPARPRLVIFNRYERDHPTTLSPISGADGVRRLAEHAFGLDDEPRGVLDALSGLADQCDLYELTSGDLRSATTAVMFAMRTAGLVGRSSDA